MGSYALWAASWASNSSLLGVAWEVGGVGRLIGGEVRACPVCISHAGLS